MSDPKSLEKADQERLNVALKVKEYEGKEPYYIGDDLILNGDIEQLYAHICHGEKNDTSEWLADKPHQIVWRLVCIALRYKHGVPPLSQDTPPSDKEQG